MTVNLAVEQLLEIEERRQQQAYGPETLCVGLSRVGADSQQMQASVIARIDFLNGLASMVCLPYFLHRMLLEYCALMGHAMGQVATLPACLEHVLWTFRCPLVEMIHGSGLPSRQMVNASQMILPSWNSIFVWQDMEVRGVDMALYAGWPNADAAACRARRTSTFSCHRWSHAPNRGGDDGITHLQSLIVTNRRR